MSDPKRGRLVPDWHALIRKAAERQYVLVSQLSEGDTLAIVTDKHRYAFKIIDPSRRRVEMISDDPACPGPVEGCLQGSKVSPLGIVHLRGPRGRQPRRRLQQPRVLAAAHAP